MKLKDAHGQVLALLKTIHLRAVTDYKVNAHFPIGNNFARTGLGAKWWTTWDTELTLSGLARALHKFNPKLRTGSANEYRGIILKTIQENLATPSLFRTMTIMAGRCETLFDAIEPQDKGAFAARIYQILEDACIRSLNQCVVLYPLPHLAGKFTGEIFPGTHLIASEDSAAFLAWKSKFPALAPLNPVLGIYRNQNFGSDSTPSAWLLKESFGTVEGSLPEAAKTFKAALALLISSAFRAKLGVLFKMGWFPARRILSVNDAGRVMINGTPSLIHSFPPTAFSVGRAACRRTNEWFANSLKSTEEKRNRAWTAADFMHRAYLSEEIEEFIFYFVALDALFGVKGKVRESILQGVSKLFPNDARWTDRADMLFDLRSELIHGGSASIQEWVDLPKYHRSFRAFPEEDMRVIASTGLLEFFNI